MSEADCVMKECFFAKIHLRRNITTRLGRLSLLCPFTGALVCELFGRNVVMEDGTEVHQVR